MITIQQSQTADTRTCDYTKVTKETLLASSRQHIGDVGSGLVSKQTKCLRGQGGTRHA